MQDYAIPEYVKNGELIRWVDDGRVVNRTRSTGATAPRKSTTACAI